GPAGERRQLDHLAGVRAGQREHDVERGGRVQEQPGGLRAARRVDREQRLGVETFQIDALERESSPTLTTPGSLQSPLITGFVYCHAPPVPPVPPVPAAPLEQAEDESPPQP